MAVKGVYNACNDSLQVKSLLRVRGRDAGAGKAKGGSGCLTVKGVDSIEQDIRGYKKELRQLVKDAEQYFEWCKTQKLVCSLVMARRPAPVEDQILDRSKYYTPLMSMTLFESGSKGKTRKDYHAWADLAELLDRANVSLEERYLHFEIFLRFKHYYYRSKAIIWEIRNAYKLKQTYQEILAFEGMTTSQLPERMRKGQVLDCQ